YDAARRDALITAAAGDDQVMFVVETLAGRVVVLDRLTGAELGDVPAPPDGWLLPFALRVPRPGRLVVLDPGGFPDPSRPAVARIYDFDYRVRSRGRRFEASLARTVRFDGLPVVFGEDIDVTSSGAYVMAESVLGALWVVAPDGTISPGLFPGAAAPIAPLAPCTWPTTPTVGGIPFGTAGNFAPGVVAVAERQGQLYFSATCSGGLYRIPMSSLTDPERTPDERANDIVAVSPRPPGEVETLHGLAFKRWDPGHRFIYATDSLKLRVIRIDVETGKREVLIGDPVLFNFPVKPQFLPPVAGIAPLLVPSDQEHRFSLINSHISEDIFQPPWLVTKVLVH
ncbi:MAG TPA: hypothetical protein VGK73_11950, partial [Polyangiaceae bacterium]